MIKFKKITFDIAMFVGVICGILANEYPLLLTSIILFIAFTERKIAILFTISIVLGFTSGLLYNSLLFNKNNYNNKLPNRQVQGVLKCRLIDNRLTTIDNIGTTNSILAECISISFRGQKDDIIANGKILLILPEELENNKFLYGEIITANGVFNSKYSNGFKNYLKGRDIYGSFYLNDYKKVAYRKDFISYLLLWRDKILFLANKDSSPQAKAMTCAMFFGISNAVTDDTKENLITTGTIHLFSVSGMHVAILAGLSLIFLRIFPFKIRYIILIGIIGIYVLSTGAAAPAVRAFTMITIWCILRIKLHFMPKFRILLLTATIMLLFSPFLIFNIGFYYSFGITGALLLFSERFKDFTIIMREKGLYFADYKDKDRYEKSIKRKLHILGAFLCCIIAFLFSCGITLYMQQTFFIGSVVVNFLLLPIIALLFPLFCIKVFSVFCGGAIGVIGTFLYNEIFYIMNAIIELATDVFTISSSKTPIMFFLILYSVAFLMMLSKLPLKVKIISGVISAIIFAVWIFLPNFNPPFIAVATSGAVNEPMILIASPSTNSAMIVNTPSPEASYKIVEILRDNGITTIEKVFFTKHTSSCSYGFKTLAKRFEIKQIILLPNARKSKRFNELLENNSQIHRDFYSDNSPIKIELNKKNLKIVYNNVILKLIRKNEFWEVITNKVDNIPYSNIVEVRKYEFK